MSIALLPARASFVLQIAFPHQNSTRQCAWNTITPVPSNSVPSQFTSNANFPASSQISSDTEISIIGVMGVFDSTYFNRKNNFFTKKITFIKIMHFNFYSKIEKNTILNLNKN